jgi:hypothetical protein
MKTARFASVVEKSGAPETYLLWVSPKQDKHFQRALAENRIMTIHSQNVGAKKDSATVGFVEEPNAQYLMFPKSLKRFAERKIIGINYELLAAGSRSSSHAKPPRAAVPAKPKVAPRPAKRLETEEKVVAFKSEKPATPPKKPVLDSVVLRELKKAIAELRAGKAVPAYERLEALVKANEK